MEYQKLDSKITSVDMILNTDFVIPGKGTKKLSEFTSKDMYNIILFSTEIEVKSKSYWKNVFSKDDIDFELLFKCNMLNKCSPRKCLDYNWKVFHGQVNTESRLHRMKLSDGICVICKHDIENIEHLLVSCSSIVKLWKWVEYICSVLYNKQFALNKEIILLGMLNDSNIDKIINMILHICKWVIWKRRCVVKYEKVW